jgi:hypothetical protein
VKRPSRSCAWSHSGLNHSRAFAHSTDPNRFLAQFQFNCDFFALRITRHDRFGDGSRAQDKWAAAVAVLSSNERGSPSYLDVSVPDRPVSGG